MPRKLRVQYPGAIYHVLSRGDQRGDIFFDAVDRHDFIKTLAEAGSLKLALAAKLRRETTLSIKQISERLALGKTQGARSNLHKWMNRQPGEDLLPEIGI